jgi:hypothetical protein
VNGETRGAGAGLSGLSFRYLRRENYKKKKKVEKKNKTYKLGTGVHYGEERAIPRRRRGGIGKWGEEDE